MFYVAKGVGGTPLIINASVYSVKVAILKQVNLNFYLRLSLTKISFIHYLMKQNNGNFF